MEQYKLHWKTNQKEQLPCWKEEAMGSPWLLEYPALAATGLVEHCFTTRKGGVSKGIFSSMNLSFMRGDDSEAVRENFARLARALHTLPERFVFTDQTHTVNVRAVTEEDAGKGLTKERDYQEIDGLVTNVPGLVLSTFYADCVPLFFVDKKHRAIGLSHSGWRGTVKRMGEATLKTMKREYGTNPQDVVCAIGPSICRDCYEISEDVAEEFKQEFAGHAQEIMDKKGNGKYMLDLWEANRRVLTDAGIKAENISCTSLCTCCNNKVLFSHRATNGKRGNLGAFMYLKEVASQ